MKYIVLIMMILSVAFAQQSIEDKMDAMLKRIEKLEKDNAKLKKQIKKQDFEEDVEAEVDKLLGDVEDVDSESTDDPLFSFDLGGGTSLDLVDLSFIGLVTVGSSTADEAEILNLQGGGSRPTS